MLGGLSVANAELCVHTYSRFRVFSPILILYAAITHVIVPLVWQSFTIAIRHRNSRETPIL